jgi:hypothetical protein
MKTIEIDLEFEAGKLTINKGWLYDQFKDEKLRDIVRTSDIVDCIDELIDGITEDKLVEDCLIGKLQYGAIAREFARSLNHYKVESETCHAEDKLMYKQFLAELLTLFMSELEPETKLELIKAAMP